MNSKLHNGTQRHHKAKEAYDANPRHCQGCGELLPYKQRKNKFCGHRCAARTNRNRAGTGAENPGCKECGKPTRKQRNGVYNRYCEGCIQEGHHFHTKQLHEYISDQGRKAYLLRTREHQCEECQRRTWLGQPIPLEMDHVDGNSDNNGEDNLRLLCPNCHALSPYAKGRNRGRGRSRQRKKNQRYREGKKY